MMPGKVERCRTTTVTTHVVDLILTQLIHDDTIRALIHPSCSMHRSGTTPKPPPAKPSPEPASDRNGWDLVGAN